MHPGTMPLQRARGRYLTTHTARLSLLSHAYLWSVWQAADRAGVRLVLGFQRRFDPNFSAIRTHITQGAIGALRTFRIVSRDPAPPPAEYLKSSGGYQQLFRLSAAAYTRRSGIALPHNGGRLGLLACLHSLRP